MGDAWRAQETLTISGPEPLTPAHKLDEFSCGKPSLDRWLKTRALSNQDRGFTAVIVVHEALRVIGYYGLAPTAIVPSRLPRSIRTGQPPIRSLACCSDSSRPTRAGSARELAPGCSNMLCSAVSRQRV
jgi:hypothetical protein